MPLAAAAALRIWLDAGHGLANAKPGVFDTGATSCYGSEHEIVWRIVDLVADTFYSNPPLDVTVVETPTCNTACVTQHKMRSHLSYRIDYVNSNVKRDRVGDPVGEVLLSVHMNSSENETATGVEVLYSHGVPGRKEVAAAISRAVSGVLGLVDRGAKSDRESARGSIAILNKTDCPAYLLEIGFVSNAGDVKAVREKGHDALVTAIATIAKEHK